MIVKIDLDVFFVTDDTSLKALTEIIRGAISNKFMLYTNDIADEIEKIEESLWFKDYLSINEQSDFFETIKIILLKGTYITQLHHFYLNTIIIGFKSNMINPHDAKILLLERSKVILENSINDWKFIKSIVLKYRNHKLRKSIYNILHDAIENDLLEPDNAGGKGEIQKRIHEKIKKFGANYKLKLGTVFDSDRNSKDDKCSDVQKKIIEDLTYQKIEEPFKFFTYKKSDLIVWHMLYKREIENYLPVQILESDIKMDDGFYKKLSQKTADELDYCKFEDEFKGIDTKKDFPELFLKANWSIVQMEGRCAHHKCKIELPNGTLEDVTEIEVIILNLAKIV